MEREQVARIVRREIIAVLAEELEVRTVPRPVLEQLSLYLDCARLAQRVVERLGLVEQAEP